MIEVPLLYEFVIQSKDPLILFLIIICALLITSIVILLIIFKMRTIKSIKEIKKNYETELKQRNEHEQHEHEQNRSENEESPDGQQQHYKMTMMTMDQNVMFTDINEPDLIPYDNENIIRIKAQQQNQLLNCSKLQNHIPNGNLLNGGLNYKLPIHSFQRGKNFNMNFISSSPSQSASTSSSITTGTTKASQLSGPTIQQQQQQQSHVKFLSPDDTNWIIMNDGDEMAMKSFGTTKPIGFMMPTTENNQHKIVVVSSFIYLSNLLLLLLFI